MALVGKESACHCRRCKRHGFGPWVGKIPLSRKLHPIPVSFPGKSHGQRSLVGYCLWSCKRVGYHLAMKQQQQLGDNPFLLFVLKIDPQGSSLLTSFLFVRRLKIVPVSQVLCTNVNVNLQQNPFQRPSGTAFTSLPPSLSDYSIQCSPDMVQFPTSISEPPCCPHLLFCWIIFLPLASESFDFSHEAQLCFHLLHVSAQMRLIR